jgi:hypothetical protein
MDLPHISLGLATQAEALSLSANWYKYTTLDDSIDCIRLIYLSHKRLNGVISCTLKHVPFADRPKYDALSYCCGELSAKQIILINGREFEVGTNLSYALNHFVDGKRDRILWIDAICTIKSLLRKGIGSSD